MSIRVERKVMSNDECTKRVCDWGGFSGLTLGKEYVIKGHVITYGSVINQEFYHVESDFGEIIVVPTFYFKYVSSDIVDYKANSDFQMREIPSAFR